jgi:hypothetical protein
MRRSLQSIVRSIASAAILVALLVALLISGKMAQAQRPRLAVRAPVRSAFIDFLLTPRGLQILRASQHPMAQALLKLAGEPAQDSPQTPLADLGPDASPIPADDAAAGVPATGGCGTAAGTRFNLEPRAPPGALPQNETAVDFLPAAGISGADLVVGGANDFRGFFAGLGNSATGYYVHRNGTDTNPCAADFEGGVPPITDKTTGLKLLGGGDAAVEADPARAAFFMADTRLGSGASTIGVFRSTAATLNSSTACPGGTHTLAQSQTCWPHSVEANPHLAVDPRAIGSGTGAGDVYVAMTQDSVQLSVVLVACKNDLSACSPGVVVSGSDGAAQSAHVRVRPDIATHPAGSITVTYINVTGNSTGVQPVEIKYVTCTPKGAPIPPTCAPDRLILTENQPIPANANGPAGAPLAAAQFHFGTYPKHDHRRDQNGVETYVVWDRCAVVPPTVVWSPICPNAQIVMAASADNGNTWHFGAVDKGAGDQYFPAIRTDTNTNIVNIAYYSTQADSARHRPRVLLRQIAPGALTPDPVGPLQTLTTTAWEPAADFFLGDTFIGLNIGIAARATATGSRAYVHYTHNIVNGRYNGAPAPEQNNHLSRFDY